MLEKQVSYRRKWTAWHYEDQTVPFLNWRKIKCSRLSAWDVSKESESVRKFPTQVYFCFLWSWAGTAGSPDLTFMGPGVMGGQMWDSRRQEVTDTPRIWLSKHSRISTTLKGYLSMSWQLVPGWFLWLESSKNVLLLSPFSSKLIHHPDIFKCCFTNF